MINFKKIYLSNNVLHSTFRVLFVLILICSFTITVNAWADDSDWIEHMAMSTASLVVVLLHEHEIVEAFEKGDLKEGLHEAWELVPFMKGTPWIKELRSPARAAIDAVQKVINGLQQKDAEGAKPTVKDMKAKFHHLEHELMELVSKGQLKGKQ